MTHNAESDAPRLSLNEPEGWEAREGYLTKMHVQFNTHQGTAVHLYREDVEAFVRQAAERYGITHVIPPAKTEGDQ